MRLALINPTFPPDHCGVGDHTALLAAELARRGIEIRVWSAQVAPTPVPGVELSQVARPWDSAALRKISAGVRSWKPDAVLVQYSPYLYAPASWGIRPAFPVWLASLRASLGRPVSVIAHELHYPVGLAPDRLLIGPPQFLQFLALGAVADSLILTYEVAFLKSVRLFPWKREKLHWIPVGTNIDPAGPGRPSRPGDLSELMRAAGVPERHKVLLQFGSSHPTKLGGHSLAALDAARKALGPDSASLVLTGFDRAETEKLLRGAGRMDLKPFVHGLGYLASWQVSLWMKRADLVLAPFHDGVSTRRTTVMAALAHGRPVLTTRSYCTEPSLDWESLCAVVAGLDPEDYARRTVELLKDPAATDRLASAGRSYFEKSFSWQQIGDRILAALG